jgi:hypothetical protein
MKRNDMSTDVKLLSRPANFAVVQLPGRKFPGVVVQGDTLHSLVKRVDELLQLLRSGEVDELSAGLSDIKEQLTEAMTHYEGVCADRGIGLPYSS